ncbi:MAG: hypothetical protein Q9M36_12375 [Sulfurovum sp.]|nr:hypothetical protein [Sulfurovum sp.]
MIEKKTLSKNNIIYSKHSPTKLIITANKGRIQCYINGALQFDSIDGSPLP